MKKILYLHGLESRVGGEKVEYLQHKYGIDNVLAPEMDYKTNPKLFTETLELVNTFKPDLIIGSSMGGYFAECLATNYPTEVLLFNPASINEIEYLQEYNINPTMGKHKLNGTAILGEYDEVIPSSYSKEYLEYNHPDLCVLFEEMGHRTPFNIFKENI